VIFAEDTMPKTFQSTLPVRGATLGLLEDLAFAGVSIHAPGEGSDRERGAALPLEAVSIHAPGEGSD